MDEFQKEFIERIMNIKNAGDGFDRSTMRWSGIYLVSSSSKTPLQHFSRKESSRHKQEITHINDVDQETLADLTPEALVYVFEMIIRINSRQM